MNKKDLALFLKSLDKQKLTKLLGQFSHGSNNEAIQKLMEMYGFNNQSNTSLSTAATMGQQQQLLIKAN